MFQKSEAAAGGISAGADDGGAALPHAVTTGGGKAENRRSDQNGDPLHRPEEDHSHAEKGTDILPRASS